MNDLKLPAPPKWKTLKRVGRCLKKCYGSVLALNESEDKNENERHVVGIKQKFGVSRGSANKVMHQMTHWVIKSDFKKKTDELCHVVIVLQNSTPNFRLQTFFRKVRTHLKVWFHL